jgi:hypothetical protein
MKRYEAFNNIFLGEMERVLFLNDMDDEGLTNVRFFRRGKNKKITNTGFQIG